MIFSHDGDFGDTIAAMNLVHHLGGGDLVLFPTNTRIRMSPGHMAIIAPLLEAQSYISSVRYSDHPAPNGLNLGRWRFNYRGGLNLCDMYFEWLGLPHPPRYKPWLEAEPNRESPVVFVRSPRYHGRFPWKRAVKKYRGCSIFLGMPEEHADFCSKFGEVPFFPTSDLLAAAEVIRGAKLVCANQTALFWIAEGLKMPVCLEASGDPGLRNCHWEREGFFYGTSLFSELPDLDVLDAILATIASNQTEAAV